MDKEVPETVVPKEAPADGHRLYCVTIITSDKRFEILKTAMEAIGITGMTVTKALGFGLEKDRPRCTAALLFPPNSFRRCGWIS